jgi:hypothetical protein
MVKFRSSHSYKLDEWKRGFSPQVRRMVFFFFSSKCDKFPSGFAHQSIFTLEGVKLILFERLLGGLEKRGGRNPFSETTVSSKQSLCFVLLNAVGHSF